jgi:prepilin-type N-terminal cleavage/methylation domain-containing protein
MKKNFKQEYLSGFTLIELIISISLLGIILAATTSIFATSLKNYQYNFQKSSMQKEVNFTIDAIANDIKSGAKIETSFGSHTASSTCLIIGIPAQDTSNNFIYTGDVLELDHVVYYKSGGEIRKYFYSNPLGKKSGSNTDYKILENVSSVDIFEYIPGLNSATQIKTTINLFKETGKTNVRLSETRTANLRNIGI